jgi:hypothetical protein
MDAAQLAASIRETIPNFVDMCLCRPKKLREWDVEVQPTKFVKVTVEFPMAACLCCKSNPGVVKVDDQEVMSLDEDGQETNVPLVLLDKTNPGCVKSNCGCASCCGMESCFCCRDTLQAFRHSGRLFEIVDYSEIPGTGRARPCFLMIDNTDKNGHPLGMVEVNTKIPRSTYMATLFEKAGKKYCCIIGCPVGLMFVASLFIVATAPFITVILFVFLMWFSCCCICGNWCGRADHYRKSPDILYPNLQSPPVSTQNMLQSDEIEIRQSYNKPMGAVQDTDHASDFVVSSDTLQQGRASISPRSKQQPKDPTSFPPKI